MQVATQWQANALIHHYGQGVSTDLVEQHSWCLPLQGDRHPARPPHPRHHR
jgi:hypothetical protein